MSRSKKNKRSGRPKQPNEKLASEYALGILTGDEKNRADALLVNDPSFRLMVEEWQGRIAPMLDEAGEVPSPEAVWREVEGQLFGVEDEDENKDTSRKAGFWSNIAFWRRLSFASIAVIALLFSVIALRIGEHEPGPAERSGFIAALTLSDDKPTFLVQMDVKSGVLNVSAAHLTNLEGRVPELWLMPVGGAPISLGVMFAYGNTALNIPRSLMQEFKFGATLAVSLEPTGGAPNGKQTGEIIATGPLQTI